MQNQSPKARNFYSRVLIHARFQSQTGFLLTTRKIIFHFFLSVQFTILPIVSLIFFDMTFYCNYSCSKLFVIEHNGSFIQSTLSFHGISLPSCFVRNGKCEKLFIKINFLLPTYFTSTDTHTHKYRDTHCTCSYQAKKPKTFINLLYPYIELLRCFFFVKTKRRVEK